MIHIKKDQQIDVVITWVNWGDVDFCRNVHNIEPRPGEYCELKYLLRSLIKHKLNFRKIFLVHSECHPPPAYLKTDHPDLIFITHRQIVADKSHLPLTERPSIVSNLHRIPDLEEYYMYFEDDHFMMRDWQKVVIDINLYKIIGVKPTRFRGKSGWKQPCALWNISTCASAMLIQERTLIFGDWVVKSDHTPKIFRKSILQELEEKFPRAFWDTSAKNLSRTNFIDTVTLFNAYLCKKYFLTPASIPMWGYEIHTNKPDLLPKGEPTIRQLNDLSGRLIEAEKYAFFYIQGIGVCDEYRQKCDQYHKMVYDWFEETFPTKCDFEI